MLSSAPSWPCAIGNHKLVAIITVVTNEQFLLSTRHLILRDWFSVEEEQGLDRSTTAAAFVLQVSKLGMTATPFLGMYWRRFCSQFTLLPIWSNSGEVSGAPLNLHQCNCEAGSCFKGVNWKGEWRWGWEEKMAVFIISESVIMQFSPSF